MGVEFREGACETRLRVVGFMPSAPFYSPTRAHGAMNSLAKTASAKKPPPEPNADAVKRYDAEREQRRPFAPVGAGIVKRTKNIEALFIDELSKGYSISASAWTIGVHRSTAYNWRAESEASKQEDGSYIDDFCVRWDSAIEAGTDRLEDEARRRAERGVERPVYQGGVMVGTVTEYSDTLMATLLKGNRPGKFNTERHELTGPQGGPVAMSMEIEFVDSPKSNKK